MYKRKTKSGGLGIVRTISKTQQNVGDKSEITNPNQISQIQSTSRTTSKTQQNVANKSENANPNITSQIQLSNRTINKTLNVTEKSENTNPNKTLQIQLSNRTPSKVDQNKSDDDEVHSDPEPSPKRSRRFMTNCSSSIMKDLSFSTLQETRDNKTLTKVVKGKPTVVHSKNLNEKIEINTSTRQSKKGFDKPTLPAHSDHNSVQKKVKKNHVYNKKGTYLEELFEEAGLTLSDGTSPNVLKTDQAIFIRDINNAISSEGKELKRNVENIMKDLETYCNNIKCLKFAVFFTETSSECDVSRGDTQDSLMRMLLQVNCLQAPVTELLMDKLAKIVMDGTGGDDDTPVLSWVRMILQCFRFLNSVLDSTSVNERLLDVVLATSDVTIQQEVVISLPDIISDAEHHHAALELSKLIRKSNPQLLASALEALTNLSLQPEVRAQVQPVLMKAIHKVQPEFLPAILKFLFADNDPPLLDEIITYIRNELDLAEIEGDVASIQVLVFSTLRDALLSSRTLPNIWQKNISSVKSQVEHKPIDVIMLLILLSTTNDPVRQKSVEGVFRNRIRSDLFTEALINETLKNYIAVIKEYFQVATKLAGALLRSTEPAVVEFASKMYIGMFENTDGLWCKWVLSDLQVCVGAGDANVARAALNVLQHLTNQHHNKVKPLGVILMLLLNKLSDLALSEVCQLMDILCHIAYSEDDTSLSDCSILQEEINILVQKQLASSQLNILRSGVVGCVMTIKHIASIPQPENSEMSDMNNEEISEKAKRAVQLLEMLLSSTRKCVEAHGLALDQLSHLLISGTTTGTMLDPSFIKNLSSLMRDNLQDVFLISYSDFDSKDDVVKSSLQFYLDDDTDGAIALNLSQLVAIEADSSKPRPMMGMSCLHPLLRLLRGLEMNDLSEIDALLGCAIAMPVPAVYTEFSQLSAYQQHLALHCLFHCINWLLEVINCFAFLVKKNEPEKVLMRLRTIIWLRGLLARSLPQAMEYTPPMCHFQALPKPKLTSGEKPIKKATKKKGKKKGKKKQDGEESVLTGNDNGSQQHEEEDEEEPVEEKAADLSKYKYCFREIDIDMWLVLTQPLTLSPSPEKDGQFTPELGPSELLFLLDDYVAKLSRALTTSNKRMSFLKTAASQNIGFENLDKFTPLHLAKNTIKLSSYLCSFLEKTMEYTQNLVKVNDGILDATGMFMEGSADMKKCQGRLLKIMAILFSWVGFQNQANHSYLIAGLQKVASRMSGGCESKSKSKKLLVRECVQYLGQCHPHVLDLASACTLVELMKALVHHADDDSTLQASIASICEELLSRQWYDMKGNREKGAELNSQASELLSAYLCHSEDQLIAVTKILGWLTTESQQLTDKDACLSTFPAFSRSNVHILIGGLLKGLEGAVRQKLEEQLSDKEQLELWTALTQGLETLVTVVKANDSKPNLRAFLKGCTVILKLFLSRGMSTCTFMFKHEPAIVSQILKKLQVTTRYIQTICNFVKVSKDLGLTQFLPPIRAVMESILLRVKSIIVINNCTDAFFMGSMKNRDLKGQEIQSQETPPEEEECPQNGSESEADKSDEDNENADNETDNEENEETGESVSILC